MQAVGTAVGSYFGGPVGGAIGGSIGGMISGAGESRNASNLADQQAAAAREASAASRFRPVGVTSRFGSSNFQTDAQGNVTGAGYNLSPEMLAQQNALMGMSEQALGQYQNSFNQTAPLGQAAQGMMGLGQGYLATSPQEQAAKYMQEQQALLQPARQQALSTLQNKQFQQGRTGLAVGGDAGTMATNPEMAAYYNAIAQQDANLAAQSTQGGMDYAKFGAGMLGTGGQMLGQMYGLQSDAFSPYQTALGGAQTLEGLGQQTMDIGMNVGAKGQANASSQALLQQGLTQAATTRAKAGDQWTGLLSGAGDYMKPYMPQIQQQFSDWWNPGVNIGSASGSDWDVFTQG